MFPSGESALRELSPKELERCFQDKTTGRSKLTGKIRDSFSSEIETLLNLCPLYKDIYAINQQI